MSVAIAVVEVGEPVTPDVDVFLAGLDRPTIFHMPGDDPSRARVVAGTLHGNEPSGLRAIHRVLSESTRPPVDCWFFVGAVEAARAAPGFAQRMLPGRRDLNRCFRAPFRDRDGRVAQATLEVLRTARPELVVDLHNNTGHNPAYGIGHQLDDAHLALAALFARTYVHSTLAMGTFTEALTDLAPAVAIECGRAGDPAADATAYAGLRRLLALPHLEPPVLDAPMAILVDPVRVMLRSGVRVAFGEAPVPGVDVTLVPDVDRHNFETLQPGAQLGWLAHTGAWPLVAIGHDGRDRSRELLRDDAGILRTQTTVVLMMATRDEAAATHDCLFYAATRRA